MEVQIQRLQSTVQAFDGDVPLSPQTMDKIVRAVLKRSTIKRCMRRAGSRRAAHYQRRQPRARRAGVRAMEQVAKATLRVEWFRRRRT